MYNPCCYCFNALLFAYSVFIYCLLCSFNIPILSPFTESCGVCSVKTRARISLMRAGRGWDRSTWPTRPCGVCTPASTAPRGNSCPSSPATPRTGPRRHSWTSPGEHPVILNNQSVGMLEPERNGKSSSKKMFEICKTAEIIGAITKVQ